jgi:NAD(P)H-dependent flavin oxidoreductase YrpB (nitropropane dioxygenase family)
LSSSVSILRSRQPLPRSRRSAARIAISWRSSNLKIVSFHFGLPREDLLNRVKATGAKILTSATTVKGAVWLEQKGCDAIIAPADDAGG